MQIREWTERDCAAVAELEKVCFSDPWSKSMINDCFTRGDFVGVVCQNGDECEKTDGDCEIIGYAGAIYAFEDADVALVATSPEHRRKNIAFSLLNSLFCSLKQKGVKKVFLEVRVSNIAAQKLYEKCGFSQIGIRKKYYGTEDALVMATEFKD